MTQTSSGLSWQIQPRLARAYVTAVTIAGWSTLIALFPRALPQPGLFATLVIASCLTSIWKVNLPLRLSSGSTLSVSYAANLMALLLLGPKPAVLIGAAGAWTQCTIRTKRSYPLYRTLFSVAAEIVTMAVTGTVYEALHGPIGALDPMALGGPLVGAIAAYFVVNTGLVAGAIALSTRRGIWPVWRDDFLWSGASFMVAGSAGAAAAVVVAHGYHWQAVLLLAPVYLTFRTYRIFVGRLEDEHRYVKETRRLHDEALAALAQARAAEHALAIETARLEETLAETRRLQEIRDDLLAREQLARASAEHANRLKDQFLAIVSHELRTPLNAVLGWADMLQRGMLDAGKRDRAIHAIGDAARRQSQLIEDLLDVARIMSGKLRLSRSQVDVHEIIGGAIELVQPSSDAKRIRISVDAPASVGAVYADGARLQQIVWNLLSNAIKFTPEDGEVRLQLAPVDQAIEISVIDTGPGIAADFLGAVFEPFRQADSSTTRTHTGLGLGLAIVKQLVEAHGGAVRAESAGEGCGATFSVRLPIVEVYNTVEEAPLAPTAGLPDDGEILLDGIRVLVVDDDEDNREMLAASLQCRRAIVFMAASVADALDLLMREPVDVVLTDVAMPGEDGYGLIRKLRASTDAPLAAIPAIALTAFARPEDRLRALQAGFQMHLAKPIDAGELAAAIASVGKLNIT